MTTDAVGNQFGRFALADAPDARLVMAGSHLDSQARAGRLDGAYGVAAALCVGRAMLEAKRAGARFTADFYAVNWTNEEGARFRPSLLGSGAYAGHHDAAYALSRRDDGGVSLAEALAAIGAQGTDPAPPLPACYLELHVEQGLVLEAEGATIGVVTRNWGALKIEAVFKGEQAHTGRPAWTGAATRSWAPPMPSRPSVLWRTVGPAFCTRRSAAYCRAQFPQRRAGAGGTVGRDPLRRRRDPGRGGGISRRPADGSGGTRRRRPVGARPRPEADPPPAAGTSATSSPSAPRPRVSARCGWTRWRGTTP